MTADVQTDSSLAQDPGPSHDLTPDDEIVKARKKGGKSKVKKVGLGVFWNQFGKHQKQGKGTTPAPMSHARKQLYPLKG